MKTAVAIIALLLCASSLCAEELGAKRAEALKANVKSFRLELAYRGDQDKPFYRLTLSVRPVEQAGAFDRRVQIDEDQALKIVDHLAESGSLDRAQKTDELDKLPMPCYLLSVQAGDLDVTDVLGWDLAMLRKLDGLRSVLSGEAAKSMDLLVGRLSGFRREWQRQAEVSTALDTAADEGEADAYRKFNDFCRSHFGAEKEPLLYQKYGNALVFAKDAAWSHVSENSAVVAWETNLPAVSYIEYGPTEKYGKQTVKDERPFCLHIHYLTGLVTGETCHYRMVSIDERGNKLTSEDRRVTPRKIDGAIYIPGDRKSPPYRLDKPGAYYVLTADIDADVTGIDIVASNLTLDLNGHTITYDRSKDAYEKVKDTDAFRDGFGPKPNDGPHGIRGSYASQKGGVRVLNGFVRQGEGGHSWWSDPITAPLWDEVAGVTMIYHGPQVYGITAEVRDLHHNVFLDLGTELPNRHQGCGAILVGRRAHQNLVKRSRHRGIDVPKGGKVYGNEIYIDSFATNAFGVFHYQTRNAQCNDNRIFGTGYHFIGIGTISEGVGDIKIDGNFIHGRTLEKPDDRSNEYGDQSGVNGLRVTWGGENIEWSNNVVVVEGRGAAKGEVRGVWHVPDRHQSGLVYHDNIFKAVADPEKETALGAVVISGGQNAKNDAPGLFRDNTIISDFANVSLGGLYYGDGNNARFERCTFVKLGDRKDYRTIQVGSPGDRSSSGHVFVDSRFKDGAGYEHVRWRDDGDFSVGWTVSIKTVPGAQIRIRDKSGELVLSASTGDRGVAKTVLMQYRHADTGKTMLTPHTVTVEKDWEKIIERTINVNRTMDAMLMPRDVPAPDADGAKE